MIHKCHWPGCPLAVPSNLWGCSGHWFMLPPEIRYTINAAFGKKLDYKKADNKAHQWIKNYEARIKKEIIATPMPTKAPQDKNYVEPVAIFPPSYPLDSQASD